ncbi:MAG: DNA topoisomerase 3 [Syntrophomonadaceae bacterium]
MKTLLITEKPSVAQDIAQSLPGNFKKHDGFLEGDTMIISWAVGHLLELAMPQDYDEKLQRWNISMLPVLPEPFQLRPKQSTIKQLKILRDLIKRQDVEGLINGCDAAREGELIFRYIIQFLKCRKPHSRLWLSETTPAAIRDAFKNLRPDSEMQNLARAAVSRSQADWIVGINATRGFTVQFGDKLTVGRVQTPTLALIVNREREIESFVPSPYYEIESLFAVNEELNFKGKWFKGKKDRFNDREQAEEILKLLEPGSPALITDVKQKEVQEKPPQLFNLNDLQKEANKKYGFTAEQTLNIAQKLYENHLITYPRTDSRHLTAAMAATLPGRLNALTGTELGPVIAEIKTRTSKDKRYVDDKKVSDHTAIVVTDSAPAKMSQREQQIYMLIARRMLAIFLPPARIRRTTVIITCQGETFISKGRVIAEFGWKVLYGNAAVDDEENKEPTLPVLSLNQTLNLEKAEILNKETKAPKRFTEADLLSAMENAGRRIDDEELREAMAGKGLGTPATRAAIIEKLISVGYIDRQKKILIPTDKGKHLIDIVTSELKDPELTAEWEKKLADIEKGQYERDVFMQEIKEFTGQIIANLTVKETAAGPDRNDVVNCIGACPVCGKPVIESQKGYGCSGWKDGCKFVIWKVVAGMKISEYQAKKLLREGKTAVLKGFKSKTGKVFDTALKIEKGQVVFDFQQTGK